MPTNNFATATLASVVIVTVVLLTATATFATALQNLECDEIKRDDSYKSNVCTFTRLHIDEDTPIRIVPSQIKQFLGLWTKEVDYNLFIKIQIRNSVVKSLPRIIFQHYHNLQEFSMVKCGLRTWHPLTFVHAKYLYTLDLSGNDLKNIPQIAFFNANLLSNIDLSSNIIESVDPNAFINLQNLKTLRLDGNQLLTLNLNLFSTDKLRFFNVSGNELTKLHVTADTIAKLQHAVELTILATDNKIEDFHIQEEFPVSDLRLSRNNLSAMNTVINFKTLKSLDLNTNPLGNLPLTMFFNLGQLQYLNVRDTGLVSLNPTLFSRLTKLKHLEMSFNNFTSIDWNNFASMMNLEELVIFDFAFTVADVENLTIILPCLKSIWISKQNWECDAHENVENFFKSKGISVNEMEAKFGEVDFPRENICLNTLYL